MKKRHMQEIRKKTCLSQAMCYRQNEMRFWDHTPFTLCATHRSDLLYEVLHHSLYLVGALRPTELPQI